MWVIMKSDERLPETMARLKTVPRNRHEKWADWGVRTETEFAGSKCEELLNRAEVYLYAKEEVEKVCQDSGFVAPEVRDSWYREKMLVLADKLIRKSLGEE